MKKNKNIPRTTFKSDYRDTLHYYHIYIVERRVIKLSIEKLIRTLLINLLFIEQHLITSQIVDNNLREREATCKVDVKKTS